MPNSVFAIAHRRQTDRRGAVQQDAAYLMCSVHEMKEAEKWMDGGELMRNTTTPPPHRFR